MQCWLPVDSGATDHGWSVIRSDQYLWFGTHVIRGLIYEKKKLCTCSVAEKLSDPWLRSAKRSEPSEFFDPLQPYLLTFILLFHMFFICRQTVKAWLWWIKVNLSWAILCFICPYEMFVFHWLQSHNVLIHMLVTPHTVL